jgi:WD40 repeat protein
LPYYDFEFTPDAQYLIVSEDYNRFYAYDLRAEQPFAKKWWLFILNPEEAFTFSPTFTFSPDGRWAALNAGVNSQVWDLAQLHSENIGLESLPIAGNPQSFSPDGQWLIFEDDQQRWWLYDLAARKGYKITGHDIRIFSAQFAANNRAVVSLDWAGYSRWLELEQAPVGHTLAAFTADNAYAATTRGHHAYVWNLSQPTLPLPLVFDHADAEVTLATLSPNSRWLVTYATDQQVRLWDLAAPRPAAAPLFVWPFNFPADTVVMDLTFSANGQWLVFATSEGSTLWAADQFEANNAASFAPAFTLPANFLLSWLTGDGRWALGTRTEGEQVLEVAYDLRQPTAPPLPLNTEKSLTAVSPNGRWLALVNYFTFFEANATFELRDLNALPNTEALLPQNLFVQDGGFSADSGWLGFYGNEGSDDGVAYIYRLDEKPKQHLVLTSDEPMQGQAFTPDGTTYLRFFFGEALLTRLQTPDAPPQPLQGFSLSSLISPPAFQFDISADSRWLAFNDFSSLRLWDLAAPDQAPATLGVAEETVALHFSAGRHWLMLDDFGSVRFISLDVEALRARACAAAGRNLTPEEWARYAPGQPYRATCPMWANE